MNPDASPRGPGGVELLEASVALLRHSPARLLPLYYVGSLPFVLGLLFFWADMSAGAGAHRHLSPSALGLSLLFVWMKCWQTCFCRRIQDGLSGRNPAPWTAARLWRMGSRQAAIQATAFLFLPLGMVVLLPLGWWFAFYQNATALDRGEETGIRELVRKAWAQARLWPEQNHVALTVLTAFAGAVFVNIATALVWAPLLLQRFLGVETALSASPWWVFNTTFLAVAAALVYLCCDPILKAAYSLRCFYGHGLGTGEDIRARLSGSPTLERGLLVWGALVLVPALFPWELRAAETPGPPAAVVSPEAVDRAAEAVMSGPRSSWRLPRAPESETSPEAQGWLASFWKWCGERIDALADTLKRWIDAFFEWLFGDPPVQREPGKGGAWAGSVRWWMVAIGLICLGAAAVFAWRRLRANPRRAGAADAVPRAVAVADLADERTRADDLPEDRWLDLADRLSREGNWRLALRAHYFAVLSRLAGRSLVTIADHKSNREYGTELSGRAPDLAEVRKGFGRLVTVLDRAWYGGGPAGEEEVREFSRLRERIFSHVGA
jgi:hypothetical protein